MTHALVVQPDLFHEKKHLIQLAFAAIYLHVVMKPHLIFLLLLMGACVSKPTPMSIPENAEASLLELRAEIKYVEDMGIFYPGIMDDSLRPLMGEHVDHAIDEMLAIVRSGSASKEAYLEAIRSGLGRYHGQYLDTEDRERTALYFQQMMDIVGLDGSEGMLNDFVHGWDPDSN